MGIVNQWLLQSDLVGGVPVVDVLVVLAAVRDGLAVLLQYLEHWERYLLAVFVGLGDHDAVGEPVIQCIEVEKNPVLSLRALPRGPRLGGLLLLRPLLMFQKVLLGLHPKVADAAINESFRDGEQVMLIRNSFVPLSERAVVVHPLRNQELIGRRSHDWRHVHHAPVAIEEICAHIVRLGCGVDDVPHLLGHVFVGIPLDRSGRAVEGRLARVVSCRRHVNDDPPTGSRALFVSAEREPPREIRQHRDLAASHAELVRLDRDVDLAPGAVELGQVRLSRKAL
mmetsp:Transcript_26576/g.60693  ORF Transcript_26576/g.60693 Transcript_26576/m.60693 type:complete len:282 (-) Transcript_26576:1817-2662(-)